ncbi:MAG: hypothetical protein E7525_04710 [Ruminococcaceae bacterium]|nr:hypothetical protein [Oscillospiraceae bacterium]
MKITKVDLRKHFNAKAIGSLDLLQSGKYKNVGISGRMLVPGSLETVSAKYENCFDFADVDSGKYDNIICEGQEITGDFGCSKKIWILGFGQWIESNDVLVVTYDDGKTERSQLLVPQGVTYQSRISNKEKKIKFISEYKHVERGLCDLAFTLSRDNGSLKDKMGFFVCECLIFENGKCLKSIRLPDNDFINVFAITVVNV